MIARAGCVSDEDLVNALLDGAEGELAEHRVQCDRCDVRARSWEATLGLLEADPLTRDFPAPVGLHASIMDAVSRTPNLARDTPRRGIGEWLRGLVHSPGRTAWVGAAASVLLVVVSVVGVRGPSRSTHTVEAEVGGEMAAPTVDMAQDLAALEDDALFDFSWTPGLAGDDALAAASSLTSEQADWVVRELQRRLGG